MIRNLSMTSLNRMSLLFPPILSPFEFPLSSSTEAKMYPSAPDKEGRARRRYVVKNGGEGEAEMESDRPFGMAKSRTDCDDEVRWRYEL